MVQRRTRKILLVGWDAADWKIIHRLVDEGSMPCLGRLIEEGCMGNLATLQPPLSPILWTSIATGKHAYKHGIHGFAEPRPDGRGVQPISSRSRTTKAIWNILSQNGLTSNIVAWWPSQPVERIRGTMVSNHFHQAKGPPESPWAIPGGSVHPEDLRESLAALRVNPNELLAEHIIPFVPRAAEIDQQRDRRLAVCARLLAECTSVQAIATSLIQRQTWDFTAVYFDAIDHFSHAFMAYHPPRREFIAQEDFDLYHGVVDAAYRYHDMMLATLLRLAGKDTTVILVSDHGFHSDHLRPVMTPAEPAGPASEHRDLGICVIHGPGICRDKSLYGLSLLDITPTLLTMFGLPVGDDMDGKPILEAFEEPPTIDSVPSWDEIPGDSGMLGGDSQFDAIESHVALERLVELGYLAPLEKSRQSIIDSTVRELRYNLARSYMQADLIPSAAALLEELRAEAPREYRFGVQLALCYRALGRSEEMLQLVEELDRTRQSDATDAAAELHALFKTVIERASTPGPSLESNWYDPSLPVSSSTGAWPGPPVTPYPPSWDWKSLPMTQAERAQYLELRSRASYNRHAVEYLRGCALMAAGQLPEALAELTRSAEFCGARPGLHLQIGEALLAMGEFQAAADSFEKAASIDPHNPHAFYGLARSSLALAQYEKAARAALTATGLLYYYPAAHYVLGIALSQMGRDSAALDALRVALSLNPNFPAAHEELARIYRERFSDELSAREHERLAAALRDQAHTRENCDLPALSTSSREVPNRLSQPGHQLTSPAHTSAEVSPRDAPEDPDAFITIVSGLPRSGTSLVMQMLVAGGMTALCDDTRPADVDNPRGYFEFEPVKHLPRTDHAWLASARGLALKVVSPLLCQLPQTYHYRILLVERDLGEVLRSQQTMIGARQQASSQRDELLQRAFAKQGRGVRQWIAEQPNVSALWLEHSDLIASPSREAQRIAEFLKRPLDLEAMARAIDPALYRNRSGSLPQSPRQIPRTFASTFAAHP